MFLFQHCIYISTDCKLNIEFLMAINNIIMLNIQQLSNVIKAILYTHF